MANTSTQAQKYQGEFLVTYGICKLQDGAYRLICDLGTTKSGKNRVAVTKEQVLKIMDITMPCAGDEWETWGNVNWGWHILDISAIGTIVLGKAPHLVSA